MDAQHISWNTKRILVLAVIAFALVAFLYVSSSKNPQNRQTLPVKKLNTSVAKPQIVNTFQFTNDPLVDCKTPAEILGFKMMLCNVPGDNWNGIVLFGNKYPEGYYVEKIVHLLQRFPDMVFVDIGCNIGTYSIPAAMAGSRVLAVDANPAVIRGYSKALHLNNISDRVTLVHNGLSDERTVMYMGVMPGNSGHTALLDRNYTDCGSQLFKPNCAHYVPGVTVKTIFMDDLLPIITFKRAVIKADIQGFEFKALNPRTSSAFFDTVDVPLIQLEWDGVKHVESRHVASVNEFLAAMYARNYTVREPVRGNPLSSNWKEWPYDILLTKSSVNVSLWQ